MALLRVLLCTVLLALAVPARSLYDNHVDVESDEVASLLDAAVARVNRRLFRSLGCVRTRVAQRHSSAAPRWLHVERVIAAHKTERPNDAGATQYFIELELGNALLDDAADHGAALAGAAVSPHELLHAYAEWRARSGEQRSEASLDRRARALYFVAFLMGVNAARMPSLLTSGFPGEGLKIHKLVVLRHADGRVELTGHEMKVGGTSAVARLRNIDEQLLVDAIDFNRFPPPPPSDDAADGDDTARRAHVEL